MNKLLHPIAGVCYGILVPLILDHFGFLTGQAGVDYYAEVHTSSLNSYIHTAFMPFTIYGMFLWIPRVLNLSLYDSIHFDMCIYMAYMTHYMMINVWVGLAACVYYFVPLVFAHAAHMRIGMHRLFGFGLATSVLALLIQEVFGHWYSNDPPSRGEAVFNAILYAVYYSVSHVLV